MPNITIHKGGGSACKGGPLHTPFLDCFEQSNVDRRSSKNSYKGWWDARSITEIVVCSLNTPEWVNDTKCQLPVTPGTASLFVEKPLGFSNSGVELASLRDPHLRVQMRHQHFDSLPRPVGWANGLENMFRTDKEGCITLRELKI